MSSPIAIRVLVCCAILSEFGVSQDIPVPFERFSNPSRPDATAKAKVEALKHAVAANPQSAETWIDLGWRSIRMAAMRRAQPFIQHIVSPNPPPIVNITPHFV